MSLLLSPEDALHTAARQYCLARLEMFAEKVATTNRERHEDSAREGVLFAILDDIESLTADDASSLEDMRQLLIVAGQTAWSPGWRMRPKATEVQAMDEERALFCGVVSTFSQDDFARVAPLPYRRTLGQKEHDGAWRRLHDRWGTEDGHWHPYIGARRPPVGAPLPPDVLVVQAEWFYRTVPVETLRAVLRDHGLLRLWELSAVGIGGGSEIAVDLLDPERAGTERYWTSAAMDWLIYAAYESALTMAGDWLITAMMHACPCLDQHPWIED